MDDKHHSGSWAQDSKFYEQQRGVDDMNDYGSWTQGCKCYKLLRVTDYMNDFKSWAQGSRCYEELRFMDDMNDSRSSELKPLDVVNNSRLWLTWMTMGCELKALNAMNSLTL